MNEYIGDGVIGALFDSRDREYRYSLWRIWDRSKPALLFIGLNPSTANEMKDDPTIRRLAVFARGFGYGGLFAGNLFALVTPDPAALFMCSDINQPDPRNDDAIKKMQDLTADVLVGWGHLGASAGKRPEMVLELIGEPVFCLAITKNGEPGHPLYLRRDLPLQVYRRN